MSKEGNVVPITTAKPTKEDPALPATEGSGDARTPSQKVWEDMNDRVKSTFLTLLAAAQPLPGDKIDPNVNGLLVEVNLHLREVMYRVTDIVNLVDRQKTHGDRVDPTKKA